MKGDIIANGEYLFKYVNPKFIPTGQTEIPYGIFEDANLSCDWEKYQKKPEKSFHVAEGKNLIIRIKVCDEIKFPCNPTQPRQKQPAWEQKVIHDPIHKGEDPRHPNVANFSHSMIQGVKKIHVTKAIAQNSIFYKTVNPLQQIPIEIKSTVNVPILKISIITLIVLMLIAFLLSF